MVRNTEECWQFILQNQLIWHISGIRFNGWCGWVVLRLPMEHRWSMVVHHGSYIQFSELPWKDGRILESSLEICETNPTCQQLQTRRQRPSMACHSWDLLDKYRAIVGAPSLLNGSTASMTWFPWHVKTWSRLTSDQFPALPMKRWYISFQTPLKPMLSMKGFCV